MFAKIFPVGPTNPFENRTLSKANLVLIITIKSTLILGLAFNMWLFLAMLSGCAEGMETFKGGERPVTAELHEVGLTGRCVTQRN